MAKKLNLIMVAIDSLRRDHMSLHGYHRNTTPHLAKFAQGGTVFNNLISPHIPTTPAYASMLTGHDCFGTNVVALRHQGAVGATTLAEMLKAKGYESTCVGFQGNPSARGFDNYINFSGWGSWEEGRSHKAENLNAVTIPELKRLAKGAKPFYLFMRHMDPHSPYLPPRPYERIFYNDDEFDPKNKSMDPIMGFKPFCDYFATWMPPGLTDARYVDAQYDGAVAYMDACIQNIFATVDSLKLWDDTLVVVNSDHGETLNEHDCYYDHHGLYEHNLTVPLIFHLPGRIPAGQRHGNQVKHEDLVPTILDLLGIKSKETFEGRTLTPLFKGKSIAPQSESYITECTWMRKHGWRTPEWKLIHALEPDFHFKPEIELYNLVKDPLELNNLAKAEPAVVQHLEARMQTWIAQREKATSRINPMYTNLNWHGIDRVGGPFTSSQQAYDTLHIGSPKGAQKLQSKDKKAGKKEGVGAKKD
ncbi:MAG TPA: sulfatase [Planctomycetota bacterium]|nr:sulfatase [Planctomycetota bacterium]